MVVVMAQVPDSIERSVEIDASAERVWGVVSEPGWWINGGVALREHRIEEQDGLVLVHDEEHGVFRIRVVALEPPRRAVFLWIPRSSDEAPGSTSGTTVEFTITPRDSGVVLTVVESGFRALALPEERLRRNYDDNQEGWAVEMELARAVVEQR